VATILRWEGYRAFFYSNERNEPPHIHVRAGEKEAKFWLRDLSVTTNYGFADHELRSISSFLEEHRGALTRAWDEHFGN
jgi:hypothetical protein